MSYTGRRDPGRRRRTSASSTHLTITKVAVDEKMSNNAYLLRCKHTGEQVLIDAAAEPATLLPLIGDAGLTTVVTTHQHWDHHRALADVVERHRRHRRRASPDADAITEQTGVPIARAVAHGDTVAVGDCTLEVIALAGHTPGSIALLYDDPRRPPAPVHRRLAVPRRRRQHVRRRRRRSPSSSTTSRPRSSTGCPTTPGSTPATATTRRSASSARTSREWRERGW